MKQENNIVIGMAADNKYAVLGAVLLKSIEINHCQEDGSVDVYFITNSLTRSRQQMLLDSIDARKIRIRFLQPSQDTLSQFNEIDNGNKLTAYHRLLLPELLSSDITKLLYLDCDTIVRSSLTPLWNTRLDTKDIVAATRDLNAWTVGCEWGGGIPNWKQLGMHKEAAYFNSGVLLVDLEKWRNNKITKHVIKATVDNREHVKWLDQYGLNVVLHHNWKELEHCWNSYPTKATDETKIVHFVSRKPNTAEYDGPFQDYFFDILDKTAWRGRRPRKLSALKFLPAKISYWLRNRLSPW
jgi:lipopolysaccharide biosynthesis glycosyltransferase